MYHYQMAAPLWELAAQWWRGNGAPLTWWRRTYEEALIPTVQLDPQSGKLVRAPRPARPSGRAAPRRPQSLVEGAP